MLYCQSLACRSRGMVYILIVDRSIPTGPLLDDVFRHISDQNMYVLHPRYRLQSRPVLEPHYLLPHTWQVLDTIDEFVLDELLDLTSRLWCHVTFCRFRLEPILEPDNEVCDAAINAIGPIIEQDSVVFLICKGCLVLDGEFGTCLWC
jgi:hypothetical protein